MDRLTECKYKCSYTFNYNVSNLNMSHKGSYIQINYDKSSGKQVVTIECSNPTVCGETTTLCLNSHWARMLHSPTQPLPRGLVGNGNK